MPCRRETLSPILLVIFNYHQDSRSHAQRGEGASQNKHLYLRNIAEIGAGCYLLIIFRFLCISNTCLAGVAELEYALVLGTNLARVVGSSPTAGTNLKPVFTGF